MVRFSAVLVFLIAAFFCVAQPLDSDFKEEPLREKFSVKIGIFPILDFSSPSINVGIENRLGPRVGLHQEVGYINNYINPVYNWFYRDAFEAERNIHGIKYFLEPRFYIKDRVNPYLFIATSVFYKYFTSNTEVEMMRFNGQYFEMMNFRRNLHQLSFLVKVGNTVDIDSDRVAIDLSGGIGWRRFWVSDNLPPDAQPAQNRLLLQRPNGQYNRAILYLGMAVRILPKKDKDVFGF